MNEKKHISTMGSSEKKISSNADDFYKNYWTNEESVEGTTQVKNKLILRHFFESIPENKKVIEFGVGGEGGIIYLLKEKNLVTGYDISDSAINNCKKFDIKVEKRNLDIERTEKTDESIDIIFAFEVFEHFSNPQFVLEEIYRILKPGGKILISIPNMYIYHWPRLFYPSLFTKENFKDFLLINRFHQIKEEQPRLYYNSYCKTRFKEKSEWSHYFFFEKTSVSDIEKTFEAGFHFWNRTDKDNMRISPIEASDLFRECVQTDKKNIKYKCYLLRSLLYRYLVNEKKEFLATIENIINILNESLETQNYDIAGKYLSALLMLQIEAKFFGCKIFENNTLKNFQKVYNNRIPEKEKYISEISNLEKIYGKLEI